MKRKLFILLCIIAASNAMAQVRNQSPGPVPVPPPNPNMSKTTENKSDGIDYKKPGAPMPTLYLVDGRDSLMATESPCRPTLTNSDFDNDANLFVMMFNPTCSHCQEETKMLESNIGLFKKSKLILVANKGMKSYLPDFMKQFKTDEFKAISIGADSTNFIDNIYLYSALPQIDIYDRHRKLIKSFAGEVGIDSLKAYIQ